MEGMEGVELEAPPAPPEAPGLPDDLLDEPPDCPPLGVLELLPLDPDEPLDPPEEPDEPDDPELGLGMLGDDGMLEDCCCSAQPPIRKLESVPIAVICAATTSSRWIAWLLFIARFSSRESDHCACLRTQQSVFAPRSIVRPWS
jgi:hypothetical protein